AGREKAVQDYFEPIDRFLGVCVYLLVDECVGVVREFSKEEVVMTETRRMAEEAKRFGEEVQEQTQKMGREYQRTVESGFETASKSFSEANKGFPALAAEMMEYSKAAFDDAMNLGATHRRRVAGPSNANPIRLRQARLRQPHDRTLKSG